MAQTARISEKSNNIIQEITSLTGKAKVEVIEGTLDDGYEKE